MSKEHKSHLIKIICGILGFFFLLFIWWLVSYLLHQNDNRLLPYPHGSWSAILSVRIEAILAPLADGISVISWSPRRIVSSGLKPSCFRIRLRRKLKGFNNPLRA